MDPEQPASALDDAQDGAEDAEGAEGAGEEGGDEGEFKSFVEESAELLRLMAELPTSREESTAERICLILDKYQEQPQLLDPHLESMLSGAMARVKRREVDAAILPRIFRVVYQITKVRGYKTCVRFFPHEVADLEPTIGLLEGADPRSFGEWETRYVLLLWLSILVIIPFDLHTVDSSLAAHAAPEGRTLVDRVLAIGRAALSEAGPTREAAAVLLAKLLTRPDVQRERLKGFFEWAGGVLAGAGGPPASAFAVAGVLSTLANVFRAGQRGDLTPLVPAVFGPVLAAGAAPSGAGGSILQRKLAMKLAQRLALTHLPPRLAPWRYQRGRRSLLQPLAGPAPAEAGKGEGEAGGAEEEAGEVAGEVEEVLGLLLDGLRDRDTVVRWSAAKGVGRVTARLPTALADDVVRSVLDLLAPAEGESAWHGGCLAVGELARRGVLLPSRLGEAVPRVLRALEYDELRGAHSVGAHVRDAACYVCWAFARAYDPALMQEHLRSLAAAMLACAVFDREVNCRRAAAAAFQENVGRQGAFPHGIEILTAADYFTVGSRPAAFTEVAPFVARFDEYRAPLVAHLLRCKVAHWDAAVRELAARALGRIAPLEPAHFAAHVLPALLPQCLSPELSARHGAALAVAEVTLALCGAGAGGLPEELQREVPELVRRVEAARLYRGRGGETMRAAVCRLVECVALAGVPLGERARQQMLATVDECARHPNVRIAARAVAACRAFAARYLVPPPGEAVAEGTLARTTDRFLEAVERDDNPAVRRGLALALAALPRPLLLPRLPVLLPGLCRATAIEESAERRDAESRRNAVQALAAVCCAVGVEGPDGLSEEQAGAAGAALLAALGDYSVDRRGDVGSWVREAAMAALERLLLLLAAPAARFPPPPALVRAAVGALLKQLAEKIDRVRRAAGEALHRLLHAAPPLPALPHRPELEAIFPREECSAAAGFNWAAPGATFPRVVRAAALEAYGAEVLAGLVVSVGGLTESLVRHSWAALAAHAAAAAAAAPDGPAGAAGRLAEALLGVLERHAGDERVVTPALKTLDLLLTARHLDALPAAGAVRLAGRVRAEVAASRDIVKCMAAVAPLAGLLRFEGAPRAAALGALLGLLRGRFPKVRRLAAGELVARFEAPDGPAPPDARERLITALLATDWDRPLAETRAAADELYALLGVERPKAAPKADAAGPSRPAAPKDDGYTALVKEMGY